ncbi:NAD(P)/FAD-dependent oxidoreductase [Simiduia agarivorans]|uniref:Monooxygenase FAD-binding protein n=1 Tax=Simiduia agarivorans (strain DSM 21679 / JCM 13881 / BCRC 17597 / SA1) TaxID=1117647 RepID=K4KHS5_SIMAS|nr:NAD(P)/FAD-dependent oxidoreductase [Simiduia agarivorans]AFU98581.1 monooxygenase FAD-binding protein [Simiduia agarivorans SA1 = DSM 21679]
MIYDVAIIGAGPAGSLAAALLLQKGLRVLVLERNRFPRFSIGESLLPACMTFLEQAGLDQCVHDAGFQFKNGAAFRCGERYTAFDFERKYSPGPGTIYQVERARFDQLLADEVAKRGADLRFETEVTNLSRTKGLSSIQLRGPAGESTELAKFVLDASGFARVLPRLFGLEKPSPFPVRSSLFTHVEDGIADLAFDRNKILVNVHPEHNDVWFWLIPLSQGRCSVGVVAEAAVLDSRGADPESRLAAWLAELPALSALLANATVCADVRQIKGYAADVSSLHGDGFALLGNAGEFLDPVFSSGVAIAFKSAQLASALVIRQLAGKPVDWQRDYTERLKPGIECFKTYVTAWYDGRFQDVIFSPQQNERIKGMISSILAGYVWDTDNPYVVQADRRLNALVELIRMREAEA